VPITTVPPTPNTKVSTSTFGTLVYNDLVALDAAINSATLQRGIQFSAGVSTILTTAAGTETMASTAATNFVWKAGRAYRCVLTGRAGSNTNNAETIFKFRRGTTLAASILCDFGSVKIVTAGNLHPVSIIGFVANFTGVDIIQTVQPSVTPSGASQAIWDGATVPRGWLIEDVGLATALTGLAAQI
jgi:hypothetical protein